MVLCSKFFDYHALDPDSVPAYEKGDRVDAFWVAIQRLKDPATGKQLYPNLCKLVMLSFYYFTGTVSVKLSLVLLKR